MHGVSKMFADCTGTIFILSSEHKYNPSAIFKHFSILQNFSTPKELRIPEEILLNEKSLCNNIKYNEMSNVINLYK